MSDNDRGLIGFLERKSLFNIHSSRSNKKKLGGRSQEKKQSLKRKPQYNSDSNRSSRFEQDNYQNNIKTHHITALQKPQDDNNSLQRFISFGKMSTNIYEDSPPSRFSESKVNNGSIKVNDSHKTQDFLNFSWKTQSEPVKWNNFSSSTVGFQSARVEASRCLDLLSLNLKSELSNVNFRIEEFRNNMSKILLRQLQIIKQKIVMMVQEAFKESEKGIKQYMNFEEERLAGHVLKLRDQLQQQFLRIQDLREDIKRPQWRKVAGEILSTDIQRRISDLIEQSSLTSILQWEGKEWSHNKLLNLAKQLRDVVRFRQ